ncbi:hypothetical protein N566_17475 [Streptomycetaceae bacterium MP113-05]|nr:hypothetical protein N566_17475 [Streptomycetaceae bacterium MP113-05]
MSYGQPGMPMPPEGGSKTGKTIAIVVGSLALVGAIIVAIVLSMGGGGSDVADDGAHKIETPPTVLGDYKKIDQGIKEMSASEMENAGVSNGTAASGNYNTIDPSDPNLDPSDLTSMKALALIGAYGEVDDPEAAVDSVFEDPPTENMELVGTAEEQSPSNFNGYMKCQAVKATGQTVPGAPSDYQICAWGDNSTIAVVTMANGTGSPSIEEAAQLTADVREEVRKPV